MRPLTVSWDNHLGDSIGGRYPHDLELAAGRRLTLAPMVPSDWQYLEAFLHCVPEEEQRFFRRDASIAERVEQWCSELDYRHVFPLLAWEGDRIVGDATLEQEPGLWTAHVAKIRTLVHPDFRRRGIGGRLLGELVELARDLGVHKLVYECAAEQFELMDHLARRGFSPAARLADFIRDRSGQLHDMVLLLCDLNRR
jgi:GNAT superfamily N-acetyltransferase